MHSQLLCTLLPLLALSGLSSASPTLFNARTAEATPNDGAALTSITMEVCENENLQGACAYLNNALDTCINLKDIGWSNRIGSIGVPDGFRCRLWDSETCNGDNTPDIYPGQGGSLHQGGGVGFAGRATSYKCYQN